MFSLWSVRSHKNTVDTSRKTNATNLCYVPRDAEVGGTALKQQISVVINCQPVLALLDSDSSQTLGKME